MPRLSNIFGSQGRQKGGSVTSMAERKRGRGISHVWQLKQSVSGKAELLIFDSQDRAEMRKRNFTSLEVHAEVDLHIFGSTDRKSAEAERDILKFWQNRSLESRNHTFANQGRAEVWKRSFRPLEVLAEQKCGSWISYLWQSRQDGSIEAEFHIFGRIGRAESRNVTLAHHG